jgi:hypothetical protein
MGIVVETVGVILWFVFEIVMIATGEFVLWALTLGRRKPRLDFYMSGRRAWIGDLSGLIGMASWLMTIAVIYRVVAMAGAAS